MVRTRVRTLAAGIALTTGLTASCTAPTLAWHEVSLPAGVQPSVVEPDGDRLLVGGQETSDAARPRSVLLRLAADETATAVDLRAWDPNAAVADIVRVSVSGEELTALSVTRSGAHGSERWSVWEGEVASGLADQPQEFFVFHGHDAGPLLALARPAGEPVIVGTHGSDTGFEADLWTRTGDTWMRHPATDPDVKGDSRRVLVFRTAASAGTRLLLAGAVVDLTDGVRQSPAIWVGDTSGSWQRIDLPVPELPDPAGSLAQATSVACPDDPTQPCWAAGWVRGHPVAWEVQRDGTASASVLPGTPPESEDPAAVIAVSPAGPLVAPNAVGARLSLRCGGQWQVLPGPAPSVRLLAPVPGKLYAITGGDTTRTLWKADTPVC